MAQVVLMHMTLLRQSFQDGTHGGSPVVLAADRFTVPWWLGADDMVPLSQKDVYGLPFDFAPIERQLASVLAIFFPHVCRFRQSAVKDVAISRDLLLTFYAANILKENFCAMLYLESFVIEFDGILVWTGRNSCTNTCNLPARGAFDLAMYVRHGLLQWQVSTDLMLQCSMFCQGSDEGLKNHPTAILQKLTTVRMKYLVPS